MTNDPQRVKDIFLAAAELTDQVAQAAYLNQACGDDTELRERVETLLRSHHAAASFLGSPAAVIAASDYAPTLESVPSDHSDTAARPTDDDESHDLSFLTQSTRSDSLGRIGHYEVLQVLGKGGFGIVFRAFDDVLQRVVAIKVMATQLAATSPARKRFLREARMSAQVRHEHVVQVYEVGEQPLPYLVMEFIPGETLQQRLDRTGPLDVLETLRIGRQIAEGLAAAHANDMIHRDIKPGNVLIEGGQHKVKITDFGLARTADDATMTQSGTIAGTPMYMAPEQALGQPLDLRSDLFSLGSVLYQMVAGRPPFRANSAVAVLKRVAEDTPRPIREVIPETPQWLCDIITKLHAKKPEDRFQSAREVADVLADCEVQLKQNSRLSDFSRIPRPQIVPGRISGSRTMWVAALLLLLVALAGTWFSGATMLYLSNRGELRILPEKGLNSVIVLQNEEGDLAADKLRTPMTDWLDLHNKSQTLKLPPGQYQLNVRTYPAGARVSQWSITTRGAFGSEQATIPVINSSAIVSIDRGQRVTIRAVVRTPDEGAKPTDSVPATSNADGWVQLFNGQDLTGWKQQAGSTNWRVEEGLLVGSGPMPPNSGYTFLVTERNDYENFHIRALARLRSAPEGDSGIIGRVDTAAFDGFVEASIGYQSASPRERIGSLLIQTSTSDKDRVWESAAEGMATPGEWVELELIAQGDRFQTRLNGKPAAEVRAPGGRSRGRIALQQTGAKTVIEFRKIEIKELPVTQPPPAIAPFDAVQAKKHQEAWAKDLGVPVEHTNSLEMKMVLIPPGKFTLGTSKEEIEWLIAKAPDLSENEQWLKDHVRQEGPEREATIHEPFRISAHEVTVGQFRQFVTQEKYETFAEKAGGGVLWNEVAKKFEKSPAAIWSNPAYAGSEEHPVAFMMPGDARAFCAWLSKKEGKRYGLPTHEQWEFACRAGTQTRWFFGDDDKLMRMYGWTVPHSQGKHHPVGQKRPNPFGLFDMHGNVAEFALFAEGSALVRGGQANESSYRARSAWQVFFKDNREENGETTGRNGFRVALLGDGKSSLGK
jgi:serine/threonine protein kinase/formylglycine-generating enzyme required for sulfatase activity